MQNHESIDPYSALVDNIFQMLENDIWVKRSILYNIIKNNGMNANHHFSIRKNIRHVIVDTIVRIKKLICYMRAKFTMSTFCIMIVIPIARIVHPMRNILDFPFSSRGILRVNHNNHNVI